MHHTKQHRIAPQHATPNYSYNVHEEESSVETSSCTSSDVGDIGDDKLIDSQGNYNFDTIHQHDPNVEQKLYLTYTKARRAWRRFTHKPTRKVRRFFKRKGKGRGKALRHYLATTDESEIQAFFQKHRRPYNAHSSGKGSRKGKHNTINKSVS